MIFSIDGHKLTLVGVDSCEIEPVVVDSVFLSIGERVNVLVKADQPIGNYWVRFRAPDQKQTPRGYSILSYTNSSADPITSPKPCYIYDECYSVNCPFQTAPGWICISMHELNSTSYHEAEIDKIRGDNVTERFYALTSITGHTINGRSLVLPESNFYQNPYNETGVECIEEICNQDTCKCTNVQKLPSNSIIQMVITHTILRKHEHTWHMHGYRFAVLKVAHPIINNVTGLIHSRFKVDINCSNDLCYDAHWMREELSNITVDKPPLKDNLLIPVGGYAVIRFYTDNPGYWLAHCMAIVFDVDGESVKDTIPPNFPTCGDFLLDEINW
ncbi:hypothetical protein EB796_020399 [Bugula neritina]|uniref:Plastocyanin-like domain-containing protein n=1 Tax=Bugula neritina TaxID=10212 RepID=A0A7J7J6L9_BUGNE|nr:hypothetical protein EB796_020399 [Bugula neritina]